MMHRSNTESVVPAAGPALARLRRKPAMLLFLGALLLMLVWLGVKAYRINTAVRSLLAQQSQVETLLAGGLAQMNAADVEVMVTEIRQDVLTLKRETAIFLPFAPYLSWLPKVGPLMPAASALMEMADAGTETAVHLVRGLKPALTVLQNEDVEGGQMAALVHILADAEPDLEQANHALARLASARQALGDTSAFPWRVRTLLEQADPLLPLAQDGLQVALVLPELMGIDEPRTYLIIAQNEDEVRPTGGFITGAGLLQVANGRIVSLSFQDSNVIDSWDTKPYDFPPQPLYDFMGLELFLYRDTNFWPDYPTSAEAAMRLYSYGQDVPEPDGAIAIDQRFVQHLLAAIGPVTIAETDQTIHQDNVIAYFQEAWSKSDEQVIREWYAQRKSFLGTLGDAIQTKIESGLGDIDPLTLIKTLHAAAETEHVQVYMRDPELAAVFDTLNWDGRLENPANHDVLAVVDANMGYNKVNMFVERTLNYEVAMSDDGRAQATLTVTYTNNAPFEPGETGCYQDTIADYSLGPQYLELADECFWNYVRVYAPDGSDLITSSIHTVPAETQYHGQGWHSAAHTVNEFTGWQTFANYLLVPQQESVSTIFAYTLPESVVQHQGPDSIYKLFINHPAGAQVDTMHITIHLPAGVTVRQTSPEASLNGRAVTFDLTVAQDTLLTIHYRR